VVVGGFFAGVVADLLAAEDVPFERPARRELDVEDLRSLRAFLRRGDVVVDAAGPFQSRSTALLSGAMERGVDVVDLNESLPYARRVAALADEIARSGVAVLSACSAVSTVAAALVRRSGVSSPARVSALVAPAARETAHAATLRALLSSVGAPIGVWRDGAPRTARGWRESRRFVVPPRRAFLVESALALDLPRIWPSLRAVDTWTDTSTPGANAILSIVARVPLARRIALAAAPAGALLARALGTRRGGFAVEAEGDGHVARLALTADRGSYRIAAMPAALAARALAEGRFAERGLVPAGRHVDPGALLERLQALGIRLESA